MRQCVNCGKRMQYRRDFCSQDCADKYFNEQPINTEKLEEENDD